MEGCDIFLLCSIVLCVLCCPYTKVEESFNMQAISDFHRFGFDNLQSFDHLEFPGVVPRTFIGALFLYLLSCPLSLLSVFSGYYIQIGSRIVLGLIGWISYLQFKKGVAWRFGSRTAQFTMILSALQFHTCFYLSRTLPNTFALNFCLHAFGFWLQV
jgi:alpha-1,6-mannosyltransferase